MKRFVITENEKQNILEMYGLINEENISDPEKRARKAYNLMIQAATESLGQTNLEKIKKAMDKIGRAHV